VVDEPVRRDADDPDGELAEGWIGQPGVLDGLQHAAAEAPGGDALLERHQQPLPARLVEDQLPVERLGKPRIDHADRPAVGGQRIGRLDRARDDRAEADEQHVPSLAQHLAPPDGQRRGLDGRQPEPRVARVVQRERVLLPERGPDEGPQLLLVLG
jgi:hypothetical protein